MKIQLKLYASSKILGDNDILKVELPNNSNIEDLRNVLSKIIYEKNLKHLQNLPKTSAFFGELNEIINDKYKLKDKEIISIIPPIGGG
jgi:molybdopterin converting factor small subunit|tara:strand:+ start:224 stop:487 length:264 start_codon:yes stop_codon:yes gene_type:complete